MAARYQGSRVELPQSEWFKIPDGSSHQYYVEQIVKKVGSYNAHLSVGRTLPIIFPLTFGAFMINAAIENLSEITDQANALVETAAPWKLAKNSDTVSKTKLNAVLYALSETLRIIAILISPVMPAAAHEIFNQLNWKMELSGKEERFSLADAEWGRLPDGHVLGKPVPLFPRIDIHEGV
jgi:methionyl-tRNA synthetase